jgi:hypothetical protein
MFAGWLGCWIATNPEGIDCREEVLSQRAGQQKASKEAQHGNPENGHAKVQAPEEQANRVSSQLANRQHMRRSIMLVEGERDLEARNFRSEPQGAFLTQRS